MSIWQSRWTCPGWVFCPQKPHPFGNKYHTICCAESGILFDFEIVEGTDYPTELVPDFNDKGKTAGLLLRWTKSVHHTGRYVVLDSGFVFFRPLLSSRNLESMLELWSRSGAIGLHWCPVKQLTNILITKLLVTWIQWRAIWMGHDTISGVWRMQGTLQKLWAQRQDYSTLWPKPNGRNILVVDKK